jgi:hypothetical protein
MCVLAALTVDSGLTWLLFFRAAYNPTVGDAAMRVLAVFGVVADMRGVNSAL